MDNFQEIDVINEKPYSITWKTSAIYSIDAKEKIRYWQAFFNGSYISILHGTLDGEKIEDKIYPETIKTDDDVDSRAYVEIRARYTKKIKKGYTTGDPTDSKQTVKPMLANLYSNKKRIKFPVGIQVKLNGIRALVTYFNGNVEMCSRSNTSYNHLIYVINDIKDFLPYLPSGVFLDGELYIHGESLQSIASIVNKGKQGGELSPKCILLKYYIFDIDTKDDTTFEYRYNLLLNSYKSYLSDGNINSHFNIVNYYTVNNKEDIDELFVQSIENGYEGLMIRRLGGENPTDKERRGSMYLHNRCDNILKYKECFDEEGLIVDIEESKGRESGNAKFVIRDPRGNIFKAKIDGNFSFRQQILQERNSILGKYVTYRFSSFSKDSVPIHSHIIAIRDYE